MLYLPLSSTSPNILSHLSLLIFGVIKVHTILLEHACSAFSLVPRSRAHSRLHIVAQSPFLPRAISYQIKHVSTSICENFVRSPLSALIHSNPQSCAS